MRRVRSVRGGDVPEYHAGQEAVQAGPLRAKGERHGLRWSRVLLER